MKIRWGLSLPLLGNDGLLSLLVLRRSVAPAMLVLFWIVGAYPLAAATKPHIVFLGSYKTVPYTIVGDPAGALSTDKQLRVRPLLVDDKVKEWTTGESHAITDRTFVIRRALRLNDSLPGDKSEHWIWQRGPWIMVDRVKGSVTALRLPDYDPAVSSVVWFRDYAAYCGLTASGKQLYAVVAQVAARKPVMAKKLSPGLRERAIHLPVAQPCGNASRCASPSSQRTPLQSAIAWSASPLSWWKTAMAMMSLLRCRPTSPDGRDGERSQLPEPFHNHGGLIKQLRTALTL